jgi:hypothetical protein
MIAYSGVYTLPPSTKLIDIGPNSRQLFHVLVLRLLRLNGVAVYLETTYFRHLQATDARARGLFTHGSPLPGKLCTLCQMVRIQNTAPLLLIIDS